MGSFKIIKRTDNKVADGKPVVAAGKNSAAGKKLSSAADEAKYIAARCGKTQKGFVIRLCCEEGVWYLANAFKDELAYGGGLHEATVSFDSGLYSGKGYSCPDCGATNIVRCSSCGKVTCYDESNFVCAYCGNAGKIKGVIASLSVSSLRQGKKK